jgi:hypothetical protein
MAEQSHSSVRDPSTPQSPSVASVVAAAAEVSYEIRPAPSAADPTLATRYSSDQPWGPSPYRFIPDSRRAIAFDANHRNHLPALAEIVARGAKLELFSVILLCALEASQSRQPRVAPGDDT